MGKWSTILGIGKKVANHSATQTTARSIGGALVHPQRTLAGLGNATKTAVMGGGMGYLAWEKLVNDKPVVRAAADLLVGEEAVDKGLEMAGNATNKIADAADKAGESLQEVSQSVSSMGASWGGVGTFLRNMTGGNGMDMLGNFFGNLGKGNVSGLGIFGLLASAMLVFGRFGWLGKIAGALLGMMLIGNNSKVAQPLTPAVSEEQERPGGMRR
ncbi:antitoxin [Phocaeicola dorei]|jgi:tetrahydromethanopterin S-methyltransferase subunit B|uniref:antitoxin n=1 Tax=Phocaeicola dorei TaxID=357276 RepID=UPI0039B4032D